MARRPRKHPNNLTAYLAECSGGAERLAYSIGCSADLVSAWEHGTVRPHPGDELSIACLLGVRRDDIWPDDTGWERAPIIDYEAGRGSYARIRCFGC